LETIMGSDFVALMHEGQVVEFDNPQVLMKKSESRFYRLVNDLADGKEQ
jgi:ABC-type multidrug transport system fused ATPase/permease subunit